MDELLSTYRFDAIDQWMLNTAAISHYQEIN